MSHTYYFEKLDVWKLSIQLSKSIYIVTSKFPGEEKYGLTSQLRRASVSVLSNIAEGSSRTSYKEQARFTVIAFSSTIELLSQLIIAEQLGFLLKEQLKELRVMIEELTNKLNNLRKTQLSRVGEPLEEYKTSTPHILDSSTPQLPNSSNPQTLKSSTPQLPKQSIPQTLNSSNSQLPNSSTLPPSNFFAHETAVIDSGCAIGEGTKIWHFSHIMPKCKIGENCNIGQNVVISPEVVLGNNVKVQNNVSIYTGVTCDDDVFLGPSMVFTNVINPRSAVNRRGQYAKTHVGKGATIGANATIVCGNDIGEFAFIGAGAVVTKYIPRYALVVGNPAKHIGWMSEFGHRLTFDENGEATCPESKEKYLLKNNQVQKN